jgi:hypothetical protein
LLATLLQLGLKFGFRQNIDKLPGMSCYALAVVELFVVWQLSVRGVLTHVLSPRTRTPGN